MTSEPSREDARSRAVQVNQRLPRRAGVMGLAFAQVGDMRIWRAAQDLGIRTRRSWRIALRQVIGIGGGQTAGRDGMEMLSIIGFEITKSRGAQTHRLFQHRIEHRGEIAGRGVDDAQHLGDRSLLSLTLVTFGPCLSKLALKVGVSLLKIGRLAVWRRAHVRPRAAVVPVQSYADQI